jgi:hypothetical protein
MQRVLMMRTRITRTKSNELFVPACLHGAHPDSTLHNGTCCRIDDRLADPQRVRPDVLRVAAELGMPLSHGHCNDVGAQARIQERRQFDGALR